MHSSKYYFFLTFFGELNNLRDEYDILSTKASNVTNTAVAKTYFGKDNVSRTMRMLSSTPVRLNRKALSTLGLIMNSKDPELTQNTLSDPMGDSICAQCVFRHVMKIYYLYNCLAFMNAKTKQAVQAEVHTLYRVRENAESLLFKLCNTQRS